MEQTSTTRLFHQEITSTNNQKFKHWLKLLDAKGIRRQGEALLAGRKFVGEVLASYPQKIKALLVRTEADASGLHIPFDLPVYRLTGELFARLDIYGTQFPLLVISAPELPCWDGRLASGLTIFLPFQNPINLGTTIRTAAALGAGVVLLQEAASPYLPKSLRAAGPAVMGMKLFQGPSLKDLAAVANLPLYALALHGENIFTFSFPVTMGLVAGVEGPGLEDCWPMERRLSIPMEPGVDSLNAAVAIAMGMACRAMSLANHL